eukprot:11893686-Alexandrium_andersonii.AAC.1
MAHRLVWTARVFEWFERMEADRQNAFALTEGVMLRQVSLRTLTIRKNTITNCCSDGAPTCM